MPLNMQAKLECDEDLGLVIWMTWARYAKALKGTQKHLDGVQLEICIK
jgi:hypothetical protein